MQTPVVVLEGINGSGKSSVLKRLTLLLERAGHAVAAYRDPGSTAVGEELRSMLKRPEVHLCPMTQMLMFTAARVQLVHEHILDDIKAGKIVLLDRWWMSTYAYQSIQGVPTDLIITTNLRVSKVRLDKDLCFFLDVPPLEAMRRMANNSDEGFKDRFEMQGVDFQRRLRAAYNDLIPSYLQRIDAVGWDARQCAQYIFSAIERKVKGE